MKCLQFLFVILTATSAHSAAQRLSPEMLDELDARAILQGTSRDGLIADKDIRTIVAELTAIRTSAPELGKIHEHKGMALTSPSVIVRAGSLVQSSLSKQQQAALIGKIIANPLETNSAKLNALNRRFGAEMIGMLYPEREAVIDGTLDNWFIIRLDRSKPLDMIKVEEIFRSELGAAQISGNGIIGDGDHVIRSIGPGGLVHYEFRSGGSDCPAGCINPHRDLFNLYTGPDGLIRVERVAEPQPQPARGRPFPDK
jgi:hypothetical protein